MKTFIKNFSKKITKNFRFRIRSLKFGLNKKKYRKFPLTQLKSFTLNELNPIPNGWHTGGPDFIGIGTNKAGTTWWYSLLLEHPQIVNNRLNKKELRYFVHFGYKGLNEYDIETYNQAFVAPNGSICGEWSPIYLSHPLCIKHIAEVAPNARILIILRNPVDRLISFLNGSSYWISRYHFNPEQQYVFNSFYVYPRAMKSSLYADDLRQLLRYFDREHILIHQYEKCKIDPLHEIAHTYRFLGVDEGFQPQSIKRWINRKKYIIPRLNPEERQFLVDYFAEDVHLTIKMFPEIDISLWKDFDVKKF